MKQRNVFYSKVYYSSSASPRHNKEHKENLLETINYDFVSGPRISLTLPAGECDGL